jgi:hypothetical protein
VEDILDLVEASLVRLIEENNGLRSHVERLEKQLRAVPMSIGGDLRPLKSVRPVMTSMLLPINKQTYPSADYNAQVTKVLAWSKRQLTS